MFHNPIVVVGSLNVDLIAHTQRPAAPGETLTGLSFHSLPGGAFAASLASGATPLAAIFASAAAAISVTCHGAMPSMPTRAEVDELPSGEAQVCGELVGSEKLGSK